jgi:hypothetical protein
MAVRIVVTVAPNGTITAATENIKGPGCMDQMELLEGLCAPAKTVGSRLTEDYHAVVREDIAATSRVTETETK